MAEVPANIYLVTVGLILLATVLVMLLPLITVARREKTPEGQAQMRSEVEAWLEQNAVGLMPWGPTSLGNISDKLKLKSVRYGSRRAHGFIPAVAQSQPVIAFDFFRATRTHQVLVRTSAHRWELFVQPNAVNITLNGKRLGTWTLPEDVLLDANGQPLGQVRSMKVGGDTWHAVTLRGTTIGEVLTQPGLKRAFSRDRGPAVKPAAPKLSEEQEQWLLAVAIVDRAFRATVAALGELSRQPAYIPTGAYS